MELNEKLQAEIVEIFKNIEFGRITFVLAPQTKYLQYIIEETKRIPLEEKTVDRNCISLHN